MLDKVLLIDGNSLFHRAYHAIPPLSTSSGEPVNAIFGFVSMLLHFIEKESPKYITVAFDKGKKNFRMAKFKEYKAQRKPSPPDLFPQLPPLKELISAFGIPFFENPDYEADDFLGTLAEKTKKNSELITLIITSDLDALQLVAEKTFVLAPITFTKNNLYSADLVYKKFKISPEQICDYKALKGDSSDNLPGVKGIGPKTAVSLLTKYKSLENIYANLTEITSSVRTKLTDNKNMAFLCKEMATIFKEIPVDFSLEKADFIKHLDLEKIHELFKKMEFNKLQYKLDRIFPLAKTQTEKGTIATKQISLF